MLYTVLQIIIALIFISVMAIVAYGIYNRDIRTVVSELINPTPVKKKVLLMDGTYGFDKPTIEYSSVNPNLGNYAPLIPSINQKGGAEYTYNFWLYLPGKNMGNTTGTFVLFTKGSSRKIRYKSKYNCRSDKNDGWYMVKNPLVRINVKNGKLSAIVTEFNSIAAPDASHKAPDTSVDCNTENDPNQLDMNLFGIYGIEDRVDIENQWNMVTIVVQETNPTADILFRNEATVKLYLNGYEYLSKTGEVDYSGSNKTTAMRNNMGNLYVNPDNMRKENIGIADLTYFNYAVSDSEVLGLHKAGFNSSTALLPQKTDFSMYGNSDSAERDQQRSKAIKVF